VSFSVHHGGSPTAAIATTIVCAAATSIVLAPPNPLREAFSLFNGSSSALYVAYGVAAQPSQGFPVPALSGMYEPDYIGTVAVCVPTGASGAPAFFVEVG
jgi:hypothetical protein